MADSSPRSQRGQLPSHTARLILRDILERRLQPGDSLGDELWCIERYGVSRGTLREALRLLTFLGAVTVKSGPHGGPQLTTPSSAVVGSALGMVIQFRGATLRTVFEARTALEPQCTAVAARNRDEQDLERLDAQVELLRASQNVRGPEYAAHSGRFHLLIAEATHNDVLAIIVPALAAMTATVPWRYVRGSRPEITDRVASIVGAIREQDDSMASKRMHELFEWIMNDLLADQPAKMRSRILWPDVDEVLTKQRYENASPLRPAPHAAPRLSRPAPTA
jgi:GntR family transcriptional regulator, transcriptional repressor for pyruvate dehydrogenase complex